jgi:BirA family biotin operon repressor/biotin-[acetyl-CoA-carboxylase] ligase
LCEAAWLGDQLEAVIMGIGLNVRVSFEHTDLADYATSLEPEIGRTVDRRTLLASLLDRVLWWADWLDQRALVEAWRDHLGTLGKAVTVYPQIDQAESYDGIAEAVDDDGALWVRLDSGERRRIIAADVGLRENPSSLRH